MLISITEKCIKKKKNYYFSDKRNIINNTNYRHEKQLKMLQIS